MNKDLEFLVEMGENMVPIKLGSMLNTFYDAKKDYNKDSTAREYSDFMNTNIENNIKTISIYLYEKYVGVFVDINDVCNTHDSTLNDNVLLVCMFNSDTNVRIFINRYYARDSSRRVYIKDINKEYKE